MRLLAPLIVALVPLAITPGLLFYFDITPKIAILLFAVALMLGNCKKNVNAIQQFLKTRRGLFLAALLGAQWLALGVATLLSSNRALSLNGGNWRRYGFLTQTAVLVFALLAAAWMSTDATLVRSVLRAAVASGAVASLYGIAQYLGWDPLLPAKSYQDGEGPFTIVRPPGTLGHADYFAAWLVAIVFLGMALARLEEIQWHKWLVLAAVALATVAIVLTGTRSAMLGWVAGAVVLLSLGRVRASARTYALGAACVAGLALFIALPVGAKLRARMHWSLEDARGGARLLLWRDSARMAAAHLVAGYGPETFAGEFPRVESAELARAYPDFYHESPHNLLLDLLTAEGSLGLLPFLGTCALALYSSWKTGFERTAPLLAGFVALLVCQQFSVFIVPTALYFYLLVALLVSEPAPAASEPPRVPWLGYALSIPLGLLLAVFAVRLVVADRELAIAQNLVRAGDARGAAAAYRTAIRWQPAGAGSDLPYSRDMLRLVTSSPNYGVRLEAFAQARQAAERATWTAEDRQNAWYNLAMLLAVQNDANDVEKSLRAAIECAPNWFKPHWTLAELLEMTNRHSEALAEAERAVQLDGGKNPEVSATLRKLQKK
jgi:O-antigen ligase